MRVEVLTLPYLTFGADDTLGAVQRSDQRVEVTDTTKV